MCKKAKFVRITKWYLLNPESGIFRYKISTRRPDQSTKKKKKTKKKNENQQTTRMRIKESEERDKYLYLARELKKNTTAMEYEGDGNTN